MVSGNQIVNEALKYRGVPYKEKGESPSGFDSSGFVKYVYGRFGISLPHYTGDLLNRGSPVTRNNLQPGDLVFPAKGHVGIFVGNDQFIHAPRPGKNVQVVNIYSFYAGRRIL